MLSIIAAETQQLWAFDLSVAALLGENVFNFGELVRYRQICITL